MFSDEAYQTSLRHNGIRSGSSGPPRAFGGRARFWFGGSSFATFASFRRRPTSVFYNQLEGHRDGDISHLVKRAQEIYAFDVAPLAVVVVPADQLTLVGVGLLLYGVIDDQN